MAEFWVQLEDVVEGEQVDLAARLGPRDPDVPSSYFIGQELDWNAPWVPIALFAELPFWLMTPNCALTVTVNECQFHIALRDDYHEIHLGEFTDSRFRLLYLGAVTPEVEERLLTLPAEAPRPRRKCKTVVRIATRCNADVLAAAAEGGGRARIASYYLQSLCSAHFAVLNTLIESYRRATYDVLPYEVSPWDVPVWLVDNGGWSTTVLVMAYRGFDGKPLIGSPSHPMAPLVLIGPDGLQTSLGETPTPGEVELLDALSLVERSDYSGAVRRVNTSIEVILEAVLRRELSARQVEREVERKLKRLRNNVAGQVREYEQLSKRTVPPPLLDEFNRTRDLRHEIVHDGLRIPYDDRGRAHRSVDTGRWLFNWFENDAVQAQRRETRLVERSLGMHRPLYDAQITAEGVIVRSPDFDTGDVEVDAERSE